MRVIVQYFGQYLSDRMSKNEKLGVKTNRNLLLNPLECFVSPYLKYFRREVLEKVFYQGVRILRTCMSAIGHAQLSSMSLPTRFQIRAIEKNTSVL